MKYNLDDTIAAMATSPGESGIGIVRLSGAEALRIAEAIFVGKDGASPAEFPSHTLHYGWIVANGKKDIVDEVLLTVMRKPRSYTREDVVEINCHGGIVALRRVLDLVLVKGARLAEPGEFTKRAFLNGRIDLAQAEAVLDVIKAKTDAALEASIEQLRGGLSQRLNKLRKMLLEPLAALEAQIDFPDEDLSPVDYGAILKRLKQAQRELKILLEGAERGRILREGISAVICGRANVGKSSLLNTLLRKERSIVTPIPGTTRDTIEEVIDIRGIPICIVDTAGILEPRDLIEKKAIQRTQKFMRTAQLVILVFDGSQKLTSQDHLLIRKLKNKVVLAVINKIDLRQRIEKEKLLKIFKSLVLLSAKKAKNIELLEGEIANLVYQGKVAPTDALLVTNQRHIALLEKIEKSIAQSLDSLDNKLSGEFIAQGIKDALNDLDALLGRAYAEDLLEKIFSDFCIGK